MALPLKATDVDTTIPFAADEALYRRIPEGELNSKREVDPSRINISGFSRHVQSAPSVLRSRFSQAPDALHIDCAQRETNGWLVFYIRVDGLPKTLIAGDGRSFDFFPLHVPLPECGAHSVVGCSLTDDPTRVYLKPTDRIAAIFKVRFALALQLALSPLTPPGDDRPTPLDPSAGPTFEDKSPRPGVN